MSIKFRAIAQCEWCGKEQDYLVEHLGFGALNPPDGWERTNPLIRYPELLCPNCHDRYASGATRP